MAMNRPPRRQYQRLRGDLCDGEEVGSDARTAVATAPSRWTRVRRPLRLRKRVAMAPRAGKRGMRLLMRLLLVLVPARRAAALLAELVRRIVAAAECPAIVFSSQWGLPALSHSASGGASRRARLRAFYLERSLSVGSPC